MFSNDYRCKYCRDTGVAMVYHRTTPGMGWAFRCHMCGAGSGARAKSLPNPTAQTIKEYAKWEPWEAVGIYRTISEKEEVEASRPKDGHLTGIENTNVIKKAKEISQSKKKPTTPSVD